MLRPAPEKSELRAAFRQRRTSIEREQRRAWAALLNQHLLATPAVVEAGWVAGYLAFDAEPDVRLTLTQLSRRGIGVALPVVPGRPGEPLAFRSWTPATPLRPNRFGISEPHGTPLVASAELDLVLMPLVAWDRQGNRLGMGQGWYDRTLAEDDIRAKRIGVGWALQEADALPRDDWDLSMDAVVTERGWFTCAR